MQMATVTLLGPFSWVRPAGQNGLMPGEQHVWSLAMPGSGCVFSVSAHPTQQYNTQALAVEKLSTAYARTGPPAVNFVVTNVGVSGLSSYRWFVTSVSF
jgi:hypothetical protein